MHCEPVCLCLEEQSWLFSLTHFATDIAPRAMVSKGDTPAFYRRKIFFGPNQMINQLVIMQCLNLVIVHLISAGSEGIRVHRLVK